MSEELEAREIAAEQAYVDEVYVPVERDGRVVAVEVTHYYILIASKSHLLEIICCNRIPALVRNVFGIIFMFGQGQAGMKYGLFDIGVELAREFEFRCQLPRIFS